MFPISDDGDISGLMILGVKRELLARDEQYRCFVRLFASQVSNYLRLAAVFRPTVSSRGVVPHAPFTPSALDTPSVPVLSPHHLCMELLSKHMQVVVALPTTQFDSPQRQSHMRRLHKLMRLSAPDALAALLFERTSLPVLTKTILDDLDLPMPVVLESVGLLPTADTYVDRSRWEEIVLSLIAHALREASASMRQKDAVLRVSLAMQPVCGSVRLELQAPHEEGAQGDVCGTETDFSTSSADLRWTQENAYLHGGFLCCEPQRGRYWVEIPLGQRHLPSHRVRVALIGGSNFRAIPSDGPPADGGQQLSPSSPVAPRMRRGGDGVDTRQRLADAATWRAAGLPPVQPSASSSSTAEPSAMQWCGVPVLLLARPSTEREAVGGIIRSCWQVLLLDDGEALRHLLLSAAEPSQLPHLLVVDSSSDADQSVVRQLRVHTRTSHIAVLQLVSQEMAERTDEDKENESVWQGTDDVLIKLPHASPDHPVCPRQLLNRVRSCVELSRLRSSLSKQVQLQTQHLLAAHSTHVQAVKALEQQQRQRAEEAERHQQVATQLYVENCRLYQSLQLSHASLEATVQQRTSELSERNQQLEEAKRAAEEAAKHKADFLSNMSHELRTPLNAVLGVARMLQSTSLSSEQEQYVNIIANSGHLLLTIINDILDYSKIEAGCLSLTPVSTRLSDAIETAIHLCQPSAAAKGLDLSYWIQPSAPSHYLIDAVRLQQILLNLLSNGIKFTSQGSVSVEVESNPVSGEAVLRLADTHLTPSPSTLHDIVVCVRDTGIGISEKDLSMLFKSFSQAKNIAARFGGTGLGLVISKRLAEAMGGGIQCQSEVGHGSTFTFSVRVASIAAADTDEVQMPGTDASIQSDTSPKTHAAKNPASHAAPNPFNVCADIRDQLSEGRVALLSRTPKCRSVAVWTKLLSEVCGSETVVEEDVLHLLEDLHSLHSPRAEGQAPPPLVLVLHGMDELLQAADSSSDRLDPHSALGKVLVSFAPLSVLFLLSSESLDLAPSPIGFPNSLRQTRFPVVSSHSAQSEHSNTSVPVWPPPSEEGRSRHHSVSPVVLEQLVSAATSHSTNGGDAAACGVILQLRGDGGGGSAEATSVSTPESPHIRARRIAVPEAAGFDAPTHHPSPPKPISFSALNQPFKHTRLLAHAGCMMRDLQRRHAAHTHDFARRKLHASAAQSHSATGLRCLGHLLR